MLLSDEEIEARLGELEGWSRRGTRSPRAFDRGDFVGSVRFVGRDRRARGGDGPPPRPRDLVGDGDGPDHDPLGGRPHRADFELAARIDALA